MCHHIDCMSTLREQRLEERDQEEACGDVGKKKMESSRLCRPCRLSSLTWHHGVRGWDLL